MSDYSEMYRNARERRRSSLWDIVLVALVGVLLGMALCYAVLIGAEAGEAVLSSATSSAARKISRSFLLKPRPLISWSLS